LVRTSPLATFSGDVMITTPDSAAPTLGASRDPVTRAWRREQRFFLGMAAAAALTAFLGFAPTYYLKGLFGTPALSPLVHAHGLVFTLWIGLYLAQTSLIAAHHTRLHRRVGAAGAALAVLVLTVGCMTALDAARRGVTSPGGPPPLVFLAVPLGTLTAFVVLLGLGLYHRRRSQAHKRLMLLATIALLAPALARIGPHFGLPGPAMVFAGTIAFVFSCVLYDRRAHKRVHPAFLWGGPLLVLSIPLRFLVGRTSAWHAFAVWLVG
jgi:hypothetical protein